MIRVTILWDLLLIAVLNLDTRQLLIGIFVDCCVVEVYPWCKYWRECGFGSRNAKCGQVKPETELSQQKKNSAKVNEDENVALSITESLMHERIDCLDKDNQWFAATVVAVDEERKKLRFVSMDTNQV